MKDDKLYSPAFPSTYDINGQQVHFSGMSIRQYIAVECFKARISKNYDWTLMELAEQAYEDADALLKAGDK